MSTTTVDTQTKAAALQGLIESSGIAAEIKKSVDGQIGGYEEQFRAMVRKFREALAAGNNQLEIKKALQEDQKASKSRHFAASDGGANATDLLATFDGLEGDLPKPEGVTWVYRPASNSATGLLEGEKSVATLLRSIQNPASAELKEYVKAAGRGSEYGKPAVQKILKESTDKADAIVRLQKQARLLDQIVKEQKEAERAPKTADKYLKAASGPLGKVGEALDAGLIEDVDAVRAAITDLIALLDAAKSHTAVAGTPATV